MHIVIYRAGRLHRSANGILELIDKVEVARKTGMPDPVIDLNITFKNLEEIFIDSSQLISECENTFPSNDIVNVPIIKSVQYVAYQEYKMLRDKGEEDIVEYKDCIINLTNACKLLSNLKSGYIHQNFIGDRYAHGCYNIPENIINAIFDDISFNRPFTLLDVNCSEAINISNIQSRCEKDNVLAYAINRNRITDRLMNRLGDITERFLYNVNAKAKYISNKAFDVLLISPQLTAHVDDQTTGFFSCEEDYSLKSNIKYLRKDGILMFIIPKFRISREIASVISKNFTNVHIYETTEESQEVIITGSRIANNTVAVDPKIYNMLRNAGANRDITFKRDKYIIPDTPIEITSFRGGEISSYEMNRVYDKSSAFNALFKDNFTEAKTTKKRKSILPFTVGQLGLILTSGCMDGLIEDEDGGNHLIKGRIVKNEDTSSEVDGRKTIQTTIHSNHVEIKAFLPNGELKTLN